VWRRGVEERAAAHVLLDLREMRLEGVRWEHFEHRREQIRCEDVRVAHIVAEAA
jgi:hypothetical protein